MSFTSHRETGVCTVESETGKRVWRHEGQGKARTTPFVDAARVYYGTMGKFLYAVDRKSGAKIWERDVRAPVTTSPVMINDKLIAGVRDGVVAAFDPATGKTLWRLGFWGSAVDSEVVPAGDGLFYIGSSDQRRVSFVDSKDARVIWRTDVYGWAWSRPLVDGSGCTARPPGSIPIRCATWVRWRRLIDPRGAWRGGGRFRSRPAHG